MAAPTAGSADILLTRRGETRVGEVARLNREAGRPITPLQLRVLLDDLSETGDCFTIGPAGGWRLRALMRAGGVDVVGQPGGDEATRRISPRELSASLGGARGGRGAVLSAVARAVGAGSEWDHLIDFLGRAARDEGVVALPWPEGDVPIETPPPKPRRRRRSTGSGARSRGTDR